MHKIKVIFFIVILLPNIAFANIYVKIGESTTKYGLQYAYQKLKQMKMKMSYTTYTKGGRKVYAIFSGPYTTPRTQSIALNNSRIFFKKAKLVKFSKKELSHESENTKEKKKPRTIKNSKAKDLFAGFGLGYALAPSSHNVTSGSVDIIEPNNDGASLLLYIGYQIYDDFSLLINYARVDAHDLIFDNLYATLDYNFYDSRSFSSNIGIALGGSTLSWNHTPLEEANKPSDNDSESLLYGLGIKFLYKGYEDFTPFVHYDAVFMEHTTNLTQEIGNTSKLQHKILHNMTFGLQYRF